MVLTFADVITPDEHRTILSQVASAEFVDGRETASPMLAQIRQNEQIRRDSPQVGAISTILLGALKRNPGFLSAVYPKQLHSTLVSRYRAAWSTARTWTRP